MQKKDDKVDNKIPYKRERERKQRERERKIETDSQVQIVAYVHARKTKELFYPQCHARFPDVSAFIDTRPIPKIPAAIKKKLWYPG